MEQAQMFRRNAVMQDLFKISQSCIAHCKTINRSQLTAEQTQCLETCGYNKAFLNMHMRDLLQKCQWGEETK